MNGSPPQNMPTRRPYLSEMGPAKRAPIILPTPYMEKTLETSSPVVAISKCAWYCFMGEIPEKSEPSYPLAHDPRKVTKLKRKNERVALSARVPRVLNRNRAGFTRKSRA